MTYGWWLSATLAIGLVPRLESQNIPIRRGPLRPACAFDTAAVRDTAQFTLYLAPPGRLSDSAKFGPSYAPILRAIAAAFIPPAGISAGLWPGTFAAPDSTAPDSKDQTKMYPARAAGPFTGELWIALEEGRVDPVQWRVPPGSPELQSAVLEAVQRADSVQAFRGLVLPPGPRRGTVRVALRTARGTAPWEGVPILRLRMSFIRVEHPVVQIRIPVPEYPAHLQRQGKTGSVDVEYVVTEDGRASPTSVRVLDADDSAFAASARDAIVAAEFQPARVRGCPVQMLVLQRISYRY